LTAIYPRFTHESGTIRKKQAIDVSKLKRLLCYESQHQSQSNDKSLVQFDYEKAVSNYLGTQSTFNDIPCKLCFGIVCPLFCRANSTTPPSRSKSVCVILRPVVYISNCIYVEPEVYWRKETSAGSESSHLL